MKLKPNYQIEYIETYDYYLDNTVYGIRGNDNLIFLTLEAAEDYCLENYPEHCGYKDAAYDFCENMIWEDSKINLLREVKA